uniref:Uncharacterized protein n=1 Tax=Setaria viridis TaxID=4556 RepID=A0A4U6ULA6_SETVI|nr:hypothetical protein SEVIR_5G265000v2 [Setaria viridis]
MEPKEQSWWSSVRENYRLGNGRRPVGCARCHQRADSQGTRLVYYLVFTHGRANKWTCGRASGSIIVLKFQNSATFCIVALVMMLYYMAGACRASRFGVFSEFNQMSCSSFSPFFHQSILINAAPRKDTCDVRLH